jgi:hydroxymethylbilane synthase
MKSKIIRIGTRGSQLALYQAEKVKSEIDLLNLGYTVEIVVIKTKGDKILDTALSKIGDKGLFTKEIENALLDKSVDIAVHSLKDLSTDLPKGLKLGAVLKRGEYRDALVHKAGKKLNELGAGDTIATSSLRRIASLRRLNPQINIVDIRGNVNTRLKKMEDGHCDGMIMAAAGLQRLNLEKHITEIIDPNVLIPAVAQGAIAIESRTNDAETNNLLTEINDPDTYTTIIGERMFLNTLQGGCQVPVGCFSEAKEGIITLYGFVSSLDASQFLTDSVCGNLHQSEELGRELAHKLIDIGGKDILEKIRT